MNLCCFLSVSCCRKFQLSIDCWAWSSPCWMCYLPGWSKTLWTPCSSPYVQFFVVAKCKFSFLPHYTSWLEICGFSAPFHNNYNNLPLKSQCHSFLLTGIKSPPCFQISFPYFLVPCSFETWHRDILVSWVSCPVWGFGSRKVTRWPLHISVGLHSAVKWWILVTF